VIEGAGDAMVVFRSAKPYAFEILNLSKEPFMSRQQAVDLATAYFDEGIFQATLARRVAMPTESQEPGKLAILTAYLTDELTPFLSTLGFECSIVPNPIEDGAPFLLAHRREPGSTFTVLSYGHGDVVRGYAPQWHAGLAPWSLNIQGDRWYGRGTADNKGQHTINLAALEQVIQARDGKLGYDVKLIIEMGEETGSPGLREMCEQHGDKLQADVFLASDGPRVSAARPTLFLGSRGAFNFELKIHLRDGAHHSGNWGGLLRNPGIRLANAIASICNEQGHILVPGLLPDSLPDNVKRALANIEVGGGPNDPEIDPDWAQPGLSSAERVFGWNTFETLAFKTGNPDAPVNAIPGHAVAYCQLRYVVGSDNENFIQHIRDHLDAHGYTDIEVQASRGDAAEATRLDPDNAWVKMAAASIVRTTGKSVDILPNLGGSLPNDAFSKILGLPTVWVPHSYAACSQHAPNEHMLGSVARESLQLMAGLFWDLGDEGARIAG
jgi:acetylornithine deacetylase/succinyl-diaminopimelate desuccinylase-like protein